MNRATIGPLGGYPTWVAPLVTVPPAAFGLMAVIGAAAWPVVAGLVSIALLPWFVCAAGQQLRTTTFVVWATVPIAVLNLAGNRFGVDLSGESHTQFSLMILVWLVGEMAARGSAGHVVGTLGAAVTVIVGRTVAAPEFGHSWSFWLGGVGIALVTGFLLRRQQQTLSELRAAQGALAAEAAQRERQRIAREVHDVVAHTLTVTLMHLQAARRALDHDPDDAREALERAETLGRSSLADIRRTVGLLREQGDPPERQALPDAADVHALLDSYRAAGVQLETELEVDLDELGPTSGLTLYRVLQESLSNAAAHAPGAPVEVRVGAARGQIEVEVTNPLLGAEPRRRPGGSGLDGMQERVALLGGRFEAGVRGGRWYVTSTFPARSAAAEVDAEVSG